MNTATTDSKQIFGKVTLYVMSGAGLGMKKIEAKECSIEVGPYAQFRKAVSVCFRQARQKRDRGFVQTTFPSLIVLDGWGHPDPDAAFGEEVSTGTGCTVSRGRYMSCDPRWQTEFDAKIAAHIERSGAKVVADFRGHNPY